MGEGESSAGSRVETSTRLDVQSYSLVCAVYGYCRQKRPNSYLSHCNCLKVGAIPSMEYLLILFPRWNILRCDLECRKHR